MTILGCSCLLLFGWLVFTVSQLQSVAKISAPQQPKPGEPQQNLNIPTKPSEQSPAIVKKPQKPIVIEEGSEAYFCLKNNGGSGCLERDRFAPNYQIVSPPKPEKTYEDYLVQYGVRGGDCGRYLNGKPNCI
ncbi:hypothetical protein [Planktothrix sp. FACHB-1365]|uniref:hypothetical protein n=1 Tax=Planktothrix sp. FACHB-1365 TaxID=2692855 RepID=UPI001685F6EF|nr:hypothetical protein [Planktothrix sp. FACHB-1365]MBD2485819.1 hypothetical protein [Planktothrix sp. FACHB-1365]